MSTFGVTPLSNWAKYNARIPNEYVREALAEFFGTMVLCFFVFGASYIAAAQSLGNFGTIIGSGIGLFAAILLVGGVSGGHVNPAVTLGLAIGGHVSWVKVPLFWFMQLFGAYIGSLFGYAVHESSLDEFREACCQNNTVSQNGCDLFYGLFNPRIHGVSIGTGFATEILITTVFIMVIYACVDKLNMRVHKHAIPAYIATAAVGLSCTFSANTGTLLNPARDLGPRFAQLTLGCDSSIVFRNIDKDSSEQEWWLVGLFAPLIGAALGAFIYIFLIGAQLNEEIDEESFPQKRITPHSGDAELPEWRANRFPAAKPPPPQVPSHPEPAINSPYGVPQQRVDPRDQRTPGGYTTHY